MIVDPVCLFLLLGAGALDARRGSMLAAFDMAGAIFGFKAAQFWYVGFGAFLNKSVGLSPVRATEVAVILIFVLVFLAFFGIGYVAHGLTLISLGDPFEGIIGGLFGAFTAGTFLRLVLILTMNLTQSQGVRDAITNSFIGNELYTMNLYNNVVTGLDPLKNPGPIYF